jgi:hypothetical protein
MSRMPLNGARGSRRAIGRRRLQSCEGDGLPRGIRAESSSAPLHAVRTQVVIASRAEHLPRALAALSRLCGRDVRLSAREHSRDHRDNPENCLKFC